MSCIQRVENTEESYVLHSNAREAEPPMSLITKAADIGHIAGGMLFPRLICFICYFPHYSHIPKWRKGDIYFVPLHVDSNYYYFFLYGTVKGLP